MLTPGADQLYISRPGLGATPEVCELSPSGFLLVFVSLSHALGPTPSLPANARTPATPHAQCGASRLKPRPTASTCRRGVRIVGMLGQLRSLAEARAFACATRPTLAGRRAQQPCACASRRPRGPAGAARDCPFWRRYPLHRQGTHFRSRAGEGAVAATDSWIPLAGLSLV